MSSPNNVTVTVDDVSFNAFSVHAGIEADHDHMGMPQMGSLRTSITASVDIHDTKNLGNKGIRKLFDLANIVTRDKIKDIKIEFWTDDAMQDAICTFTFSGWISAFHVDGGGGMNHTLHLRLTPSLDQKNFTNLKVGN